MQKKISNRRKKYYIDKSFQLSFIMKFCALIIITSLLAGVLIYYFNRQTTTVAFEDLKVVVKSTSDFILPIMVQILVIVTLLVGAGTIIVALFTSHRIAGPLYRLRTDLERVKKGDLSFDMRVRSKDQFKRIVSEFNEVRLGLKDSIGDIKKNWSSAKSGLSKINSEIKDEEEKKRLKDNIEKIDSVLAKFKIE
ncbi:MAG: methyl-accepting chemotaxis protein [Candidatus Omnitrophota bacterium]